MGFYLLTEREYNELTNGILVGLDAVRTQDEWVYDEAIELLSDALVILDDLQQHGNITMNDKTKDISADEVIEEIKAEVKEEKAKENKEGEAKEAAVVAGEAKNDASEPSVA